MTFPPESESPDAAADPTASPAVGPSAVHQTVPVETQPAAAEPDGGLPEWEPLTPELVEEEAIRGDIVLRGAIVLLALLFGWTHVADTSILTRIRTGQYLQSHGVLPPQTDVFSSSAADHAWINLGWLDDLALAALFGAQRDWALTIWAAVAAAMVFWMVGRTSIPGARTWWSSIVAAIALVAAFPWLTPGPEIVTLLGTAWLLWSIQLAEQGRDRGLWLRLAPAFLIWGNTDPHAWIGIALVWAYALGVVILRGDAGRTSATFVKSVWIGTAAATVAAMVHPFHWHVLEAPFLQFGVEYPEIRKYASLGTYFEWMWYSMTDPVFWRVADLHAVAGAATAVIALLTLLLNIRRMNAGHWLIWLAANGAALAAGHFLPVAAIVNAVVAGLNAQAWTRRSLRQSYSVKWSELFYSRGGRAVTVVALFAIAYLMINGVLTGPDGRRLGLGFDWRLKTAISSFERLVQNDYDDRPLNGRIEHGDILVWVGQKPFVDSRILLYARGPINILEIHRAAFRAMMPAQDDSPESGRPDVWKETFDRYKLTHVDTRLTGDDEPTKYRLLLMLMMNQELRLTRLEAAAAVFYRNDAAADPAVKAFADSQPGVAFVAQAFRGEDHPPLPSNPAWPREITTYDRWLIQPEPSQSEAAQLAAHYAVLADEIPPRMDPSQGPLDVGVALRVLAIQQARRALREDPNSSRSSLILGRMYGSLHAQERSFMAGFGINYVSEFRSNEMLAAYYAALLTSPHKVQDHEALARVLPSVNYQDVALEHIKQVHALTGEWTALPKTDPNFVSRRDENRELYKQLNEHVVQVEEQVASELEKGTDIVQVAQAALGSGCPQLALKTLTDNDTDLVQNPIASLLKAQMLLAVGRTEDAWDQLEGLEPLIPKGGEIESIWRTTTAFANIAFGDYARGEKLWHDDLTRMAAVRAKALLDGGPLQSAFPLKLDLYAASRGRTAADVLFSFPERWSMIQYLRAMANIERGQLQAARYELQQILDAAPDTSIRPLVVYYDFLLTGKRDSFEGPSQQIPVWGEMFTQEAPSAAPPADAQGQSGNPGTPAEASETPPPPPADAASPPD